MLLQCLLVHVSQDSCGPLIGGALHTSCRGLFSPTMIMDLGCIASLTKGWFSRVELTPAFDILDILFNSFR